MTQDPEMLKSELLKNPEEAGKIAQSLMQSKNFGWTEPKVSIRAFGFLPINKTTLIFILLAVISISLWFLFS